MALFQSNHTPQVRWMVVALRGWPDAGGMADSVFSLIQKKLPCRRIARMMMDDFLDTAEHRPVVEIRHGILKDLRSHAIDFYQPEDPAHRHVAFAVGPEPTVRWEGFLFQFFAVVKNWECEKLLLLGSLYDQIFYDEVRISGVATNSEGYNLLRRWKCQPADYEGPASVHSAILKASVDESITAVNLWAHVPFYLKSPQELLIHRIMEIVGDFAEIPWDLGDILEQWKNREWEIEQILSQDPSLAEQLRELRKQNASPAGGSAPHRGEVIDISRFQKRGKNDDKDRS